jgi:hypothetical protein
MEANYPISVITDGMGLNITVMSYCGHLDFGIVADRQQMPDVWRLIEWLGDELEELKSARAPAVAEAAGGDGADGAADDEHAPSPPEPAPAGDSEPQADG